MVNGITAEKNEAGAITSRFEPNWRSWPASAGAIGWLSCESVNPTRKSFQTKSTWKIASAAIAGRPSGSTTLKNSRHSEAPSMRAASIRSRGIPAKKFRNRKIANGKAKAVWKRIRPKTVS